MRRTHCVQPPQPNPQHLRGDLRLKPQLTPQTRERIQQAGKRPWVEKKKAGRGDLFGSRLLNPFWDVRDACRFRKILHARVFLSSPLALQMGFKKGFAISQPAFLFRLRTTNWTHDAQRQVSHKTLPQG
jgi:hypothetical protein